MKLNVYLVQPSHTHGLIKCPLIG